MKLKKSFGTLLASAILLTTVSPMASASESLETQKAVSNSSAEIEKDNKVLDDLFRNPEYVTEQTINNLPTNLKDKYVEPALNNILKQEQATWGNVEGQVAQALMGTGIKDSSARSIAFWVSQVGQTLI